MRGLPSAVATPSAPARPVVVRTVAVDDPGDLIGRLPEGPVVSWIREGDGLVGWGELARLELGGPDAAAQAEAWFSERCSEWVIENEVGGPGTGPVLFCSLAFDDRLASSIFVLPRVVLGRRAGVTWMTTFGGPESPPVPMPEVSPPVAPERVRFAEGAQDPAHWCSAVDEAVRRIRAGGLGKVVLARDLLAHTEPAVDARYLLGRLAAGYPSCWTFAVAGLLGATPEMLVSRFGPAVTSRVLAGTGWGPDAARTLSAAKDQQEHAYAARSVADVLARYCDELDVPDRPSLLRLPNVVHLATVMTGQAREPISALRLADALHPTAAVCGTPTDVARDLIPELERMNRGRYAGPVGWVDACGDGEFGIALRCAQLSGSSVRMYAGGGIVADSDPERELAETQNKFVVMRDALSG